MCKSSAKLKLDNGRGLVAKSLISKPIISHDRDNREEEPNHHKAFKARGAEPGLGGSGGVFHDSSLIGSAPQK
jgi:hypothetical protein